jgi:hypothetical protein
MSALINLSVQSWHSLIKQHDDDLLNNLLHDDVVFHSPVVFTPQRGKFLTFMYLKAASHVLGGGSFHYTKEVVSGQHAMLEFDTMIDDTKVNGIDIITFDEMGKIIEFKVMVRPLQAVNKIHQKMSEMLEAMKRK